ncbi:MAG TPA: hypothetical protein VFR18_13025, partial [Terriglobia bacterium]|nr:hypothetical protein [Terriglobia bacterium]
GKYDRAFIGARGRQRQCHKVFVFGLCGSTNLERVFGSELSSYCQIESLEKAPVDSGRLQAICPKLRGNIISGTLELRTTISSAFQFIGGEKRNVLLILLCRKVLDRDSGGKYCRRENKTQQDRV